MDCPNKNSYCLVYGMFTPENTKNNKYKTYITPPWIQKYESLFVIDIGREWYVPSIVCEYCRRGIDSDNKEITVYKIKYGTSVIWHPRDEHVPDECYFCTSEQLVLAGRRTNWKTRAKMNYPFHLGTTAPNARTDFRKHSKRTAEEVEDEENDDGDPDFCPPPYTEEDKKCFDMKEFKNLVRVLDLPLYLGEFLASVLKGKRLTTKEIIITGFRNRQQMKEFGSCFTTDLNTLIVYCKDIPRLFRMLNHPYQAKDWRFFVDSSIASLKGVLVHIGNKYPSVPLLYTNQTEEDLEKIEKVLDLLEYSTYKWKLSADMKIVSVLMGLKDGYCRMQCYICKWQGRMDECHYDDDYAWEPRDCYEVNDYESVVYEPLVEQKDIIIPPLHVKLGLVKHFLKALWPRGKDYLEHFFPKLSAAQLDEGT